MVFREPPLSVRPELLTLHDSTTRTPDHPPPRSSAHSRLRTGSPSRSGTCWSAGSPWKRRGPACSRAPRPLLGCPPCFPGCAAVGLTAAEAVPFPACCPGPPFFLSVSSLWPGAVVPLSSPGQVSLGEFAVKARDNGHTSLHVHVLQPEAKGLCCSRTTVSQQPWRHMRGHGLCLGPGIIT